MRCNLVLSDVRRAINEYDRAWSYLDASVWDRSRRARVSLLGGANAAHVENFVWFAAKSWGKVQGIKTEARAAAATVLLSMEWSPELFQEYVPNGEVDENFAVNRVLRLVSGMNEQGIKREEFSAASKILHWLMPWRVPIKDDFVRKMLGVSKGHPQEATYRQIVRWEFDAVNELLSGGDSWLGISEPKAALRALDKYLWWAGGGKDSGARGAMSY